MFKIIGNPEGSEHLSVLHKLIKQFIPFSQKKLGFDQPVTINLLADPENALNPLGKTAHYEPNSKKITLFVAGRHPKDIMRSLSHELVHHDQNCKGQFTSGTNTDPGYAQNDEHLRNMEKQAYLLGNLRFRDWEDGIKQQQQENKRMSAKKLINKMTNIIYEALEDLEEGKDHDCDKEHPNISHKEWEEKQEKLAEQDELEETNESLNEDGGPCSKAKNPCPPNHKCADKGYKADCIPEKTNENWFKGDKDQLLFEELTRKWTKKR